VSEALPRGWSWDAEEGPWACHAIGPECGQGVTVHRDGSLGTSGRKAREVIAICYRRAARIFKNVIVLEDAECEASPTGHCVVIADERESCCNFCGRED
jgi:hypothetical protein